MTVPAQDSVQALAAKVSGVLPALSDLVGQPTATPGYSNGNLAYLTTPTPSTLNVTTLPNNSTPLVISCGKGQPYIDSFQASPEVGLPPLPVAFSVETNCAGHVTWTFGDGNVSYQNMSENGTIKIGLGTYVLYNWTHTYRFPGSFVALFSITIGGKATDSTNIYVEPAGISFRASPEYGNPPLRVLFSDETVGAVGYSASWKFGDLNTSIQTSPNGSAGKGLTTYQWWNYTHLYHYLGAFLPNVTVSNSTHYVSATTNVYASFVPSLFYSFYNESGLIAKGYNGSYSSIGLVEACLPAAYQDALVTNLKTFDTHFNLSSATVKFVYPGEGCPVKGTTWGVNETNLDIQWAHVAAPGARIYVCLAASFTVPVLESCDSWFYSNHVSTGVNIVSNSWGFCAQEEGGYAAACTNNTDPYAGVWNESNLAGMTLLASVGDTNPVGCDRGSYDAANPYGIAVGGTTITAVGPVGSYGSEERWDTNVVAGYCPRIGGTMVTETKGETDGASWYYLPPSWQNSTLLNTTHRYFPDISMVADPATGVPIVSWQGLWAIVGGDSIGAPIWAGILDMLFQAGAPHLSGFAGFFLYSAAAQACFHDYAPGPTRDGLGTPDVGCLAGA
jgi:hypothetical protein